MGPTSPLLNISEKSYYFQGLVHSKFSRSSFSHLMLAFQVQSVNPMTHYQRLHRARELTVVQQHFYMYVQPGLLLAG